ncbi:type II toxin-antitoxin system HicB family antitoxin [Pseudomonas sp. Leaf129]|uniref:type II toxin-antitoxin system HicB family antitoxin n=1 Tax=Pseudomonas sp. Leaf129 TaxID=1736268 RepID=UPI0009EBCB9F|nr:type II toxin-antitoxin system HicB family antitoxin [Pseudomonas sp. Leaf129]
MRYPICIEWGDETTAVGIQVPDIPGAITAGDTFEEAYSAAVEIAHIMLEEIAARGERISLPSATAVLRNEAEYTDMSWGMLDIDITPYLGKTEKVNATPPGFVITRISHEEKNGDNSSMRRVMIIGQPGSGISTLAHKMGTLTGLPVFHIDTIHWQSGWIERSTQEKHAFATKSRPRICGYSKAGTLRHGITESLELIC